MKQSIHTNVLLCLLLVGPMTVLARVYPKEGEIPIYYKEKQRITMDQLFQLDISVNPHFTSQREEVYEAYTLRGHLKDFKGSSLQFQGQTKLLDFGGNRFGIHSSNKFTTFKLGDLGTKMKTQRSFEHYNLDPGYQLVDFANIGSSQLIVFLYIDDTSAPLMNHLIIIYDISAKESSAREVARLSQIYISSRFDTLWVFEEFGTLKIQVLNSTPEASLNYAIQIYKYDLATGELLTATTDSLIQEAGYSIEKLIVNGDTLHVELMNIIGAISFGIISRLNSSVLPLTNVHAIIEEPKTFLLRGDQFRVAFINNKELQICNLDKRQREPSLTCVISSFDVLMIPTRKESPLKFAELSEVFVVQNSKYLVGIWNQEASNTTSGSIDFFITPIFQERYLSRLMFYPNWKGSQLLFVSS